MRGYRCSDCPPDAGEHEAGARGPLPDRCPAHRAAREARRTRRKRSPLHVVPDGAVAPPAPAPEPTPEPVEPDEQAPAPGSIAEALEANLADVCSKHPFAATYERVAAVLAMVLDSPVILIDPRILPPVSKELGRVLDELRSHEEAETDELFAGAAPVVVTSA